MQDVDYLDGGSGAGPGPDPRVAEEQARLEAERAQLEAEYLAGAQSIVPDESGLPEPERPLAPIGGAFKGAGDQALEIARRSDSTLESAAGYGSAGFMYLVDFIAGPIFNAPNNAETAGEYVGRATQQDDLGEAATDLLNAKMEADQATLAVASMLLPGLALETKALQAEARLLSTRGPASGPKIISPPKPGQILLGGADNPMGAMVLEGHGSTVTGSFTVPQGTYLQLPNSLFVTEKAAQAAAIRGTYPAGQSFFIGPGGSAPNLVLHPPTPNMFVRPSSTIVTRPTLLQDVLEPNMGVCVWGACR
jgi:hypothetical protein